MIVSQSCFYMSLYAQTICTNYCKYPHPKQTEVQVLISLSLVLWGYNFLQNGSHKMTIHVFILFEINDLNIILTCLEGTCKVYQG